MDVAYFWLSRTPFFILRPPVSQIFLFRIFMCIKTKIWNEAVVLKSRQINYYFTSLLLKTEEYEWVSMIASVYIF